MDTLLLTLDKHIKYLILQDNNLSLFILQESQDNKKQQFIYMKKKDMALMMVILLSLDKLKEWVKLTENNLKFKLKHQAALLLEILVNSLFIKMAVLPHKLKFLFKLNSLIYKKVYDILMLLIQEKCQLLVGINSAYLNNYI